MDDSGRLSVRGQVAIENLVLYAAVIIVVLLGILALWQSGAFSPPLHKRGTVGFQQIIPTDWVVSRSDKVFLSLKSDSEAAVYIDKLWVNLNFTRMACPSGPEKNLTIQPGQTYVVSLDCPGLASEYELGDEYEMDVSINYTNTYTRRRYFSNGKVYGLMELVDSDWKPPIPTTTTDTTLPLCFYHPCNESGEMDPLNCGDITNYKECRYCPQNLDLFPDGIRKCWYRGSCGDSCSINKDCKPDDFLNLCKECVDNVCRETTEKPKCGPCPPFDFGSFASAWCNDTACPYCYHTWTQNSGLIGDGYDMYQCTRNDSCGLSCENTEFDDYKECQTRCTHCAEDIDTGLATCDQGDCGRRCGPGAEQEDCNLGCMFCNMTTYRCEMGDCGKPCGPANPSQVCEYGCDVCYDSVCVKSDIGVSIVAYNGTKTPHIGKVVKESQTVYLDAYGQSSDGISKILVSKGIPKPRKYMSCDAWAQERNRLGRIDNPQADQWIADNGIQWFDPYDCSPPTNPLCASTWMTSEATVNNYCYFAIAQKYSPSGNGRWSRLVADYIQVGLIEVYLIAPRPNT